MHMSRQVLHNNNYKLCNVILYRRAQARTIIMCSEKMLRTTSEYLSYIFMGDEFVSVYHIEYGKLLNGI